MGLQDRVLFRVINGSLGLARGLGAQIPKFDPAALEHKARRQTGLSDFGPARYQVPLERLCRSYANDQDLTSFGRMFVHGMLLKLLENRLKIAQSLKGDPGIARETIRRPLFVLGLPRTGTTLLFNLLAQDPACRPLMNWESTAPAPSPRVETYETDRRIAETRSRVKTLHRLLPDLHHIHEFPLQGPEECLGLLFNVFLTPFFRGAIPDYRDWLDDIGDDEVDAAYAEYRTQLQLLQRHVKGAHWILKCPSHLYGLGSLLRTFPDACVVQTHRGLAKSVPSLFSLSETFEQFCYRPVQRERVVHNMLRSVGQLLDRGLRGRDAADPQGTRVLDIRFEETVQQPLATVERIYAHFGYPFTPEYRGRLEAFLAEDARQRKSVQHKYTLEDYGLTAGQLDERFAPYVQRYGAYLGS